MSRSSFRRMIWPVVATLCLAGGIFVGPNIQWHAGPLQAYGQNANVESAKPTTKVEPAQVALANDLSHAFRAVHNAIRGAVVNIDMQRDVKVATPQIPDELRKMLPPGTEINPGNGGSMHEAGTGSGVIVSADGYILTNNHVVEGASTLTVRLDGGRELQAKVIGTDPKTDLAVIKIDAKDLTYAKFGDSDDMDVGDWVLAFGSPFGFDQTMTQGIISAKGRQVNIIGQNNPALAGLTYENFIQTDAAINPGNSGGPLVNLKGEVIGINSAIASKSGAYNGIGFSIPSNDAKYIMDSLIKNGKVVRGYLGVGIADVHSARAEASAIGYTGDNGVLVKEVKADSPGGKGGLQLNDVITSINGKTVATMTELRTLIARTAPGDKIKLEVYRDGKNTPLEFAVGEQPETAVAVAAGHAQPETPVESELKDLGITVTEAVGGVKVTGVEPGSLAADSGLTTGDVITQVQKTPVKSADDLRTALKGQKLSKGIQLVVRSEDGRSTRSVFLRAT